MINIDLTTLQGWNDLPDGTYDITVGATADGYTRIKQSQAVSVTKETPAEYFLTFKSKNGTQFDTYMNVADFTTWEASPGISWDGTVEYSIDKTNWITWDGTAVTSSSVGEIYFRGIGNTYFATANDAGSFTFNISNDTIAIKGNIENLLDYQTVKLGNHPTMADSCFMSVFSSIDLVPRNDIESAEDLILGATTLVNGCYSNMFQGCALLTTVPELPATTLAEYCYNSMFESCTSLTRVPVLPATTLQEACYNYMFQNCTSLYVSDIQTADAQYEWRIPVNGIVAGAAYPQIDMFTDCLGTRSSNGLAGEVGQQYIYYTQNPPVGSN